MKSVVCRYLLVFAWLVATHLSTQAAADRRIALVIGNAGYAQGALKNPVNDARDIRDRLESLGFRKDDIVYRENLKTAEVGGTLREFRKKLETAPGAIGMVFYAGHGFQFNGENYFPTVDAHIESEEDVPLQSLHLRQLLETLAKSKTRMNLVFLDACRDNPFKRAFRLSANGLARSDGPLPSGMLIAYATKPSSVAFDGQGKNGIFTKALLEHMGTPNLAVEQMFKQVVNSVRRQTQNRQEPWSEGSIEGDFAFAGAVAPSASAVQVAVAAEPSPAEPQPQPRQMEQPIDENERRDWTLKQDRMRVEFTKLSNFGGAPALAAAKWNDFLGNWSQDNPLSGEDEALRTQAEERLGQAQAAATRPEPVAPGESLRDCRDCPELVLLPPGKMVMGSPDNEADRDADEGPWRETRIDYRLAVGRTEISRAEFQAFVLATGYRTEAERGDGCEVWSGALLRKSAERNWRNPGFPQAPNHPVVCVSWNDAQQYLRWLNMHSGGKSYRLLSEAEWEYAARAGATARFPWGDEADGAALCEHANAADQSVQTQVPGAANLKVASCSDRFAYTGPVDAQRANAFKLHAMLGNASEWVQDCYAENAYAAGQAPQDGRAMESSGRCEQRAHRGGSWFNLPAALRLANRSRGGPDRRTDAIGFRVARTLASTAP